MTQTFRSKFEENIFKNLTKRGKEFSYESEKILYQKLPSNYLVDFKIKTKSGLTIYIESKGYFEAKDRAKHLLIKDQHPEVDLRFLFQNSKNTLSKKSKTTYAKWCDRHGFKHAEGTAVPERWMDE